MGKYVLFLLLCFMFVFPTNTFAHMGGIPIMKINGVYTKVYPAQSVSTSVFDLPLNADIGAKNYLKEEMLHFRIDADKLAIPSELLSTLSLTWDFGDGTKPITKDGLEMSHVYTKIGTFVMQVTAQSVDGNSVDTQIIQATVLNILPDKSYILPTAVISINGKVVPKNTFPIDLNKALIFDASKSQAKSSKIIAYQWDLDDGTTTGDISIEHQYRLPQYYATPLLRVKDANGFFVDTYVTMQNSGKNEPNDPQRERTIKTVLFIVGGVVSILFVLVIFFLYKKNKK